MEFLRTLVLVVLLAVAFGGCSSIDRYLGSTEAVYVLPSGESLTYKSNKNQENFKAKIGLDASGKLNQLEVETTATTPEAAIARFAEAQAKMIETLNQFLIKLSEQLSLLAAAGKTAGS